MWVVAAAVVLLIVMAPRQAWITLAVAAIGALAVSLIVPSGGPLVASCFSPCGGSQPGWYTGEETLYSPGITDALLTLPFDPAWLIVAGLLGWAIRRRSWRTAVATAVYGAAVWTLPNQAPIILFAAAAAAIGPRRDGNYLAGIGILALAVTLQQGSSTFWVTLAAISVSVALGVTALIKKNGANAAVALVSLASAPLTPFLSAGVLLATALARRTAARSAGTPSRQPAA